MTKRDPTRGVGWGAGWAPPPQASEPAQSAARPAYSYLRESPGFTQHVLEQARKNVGKIGGQFSDLFEKFPRTPTQQQARDYFLSLNKNEQAALLELAANSTL